MLRSYDWECCECEAVNWFLLNVPHGENAPRETIHECKHCEKITRHERLISLTAPYCGERQHSPQMFGGSFDTMGNRSEPVLPDLPGQEKYESDVQKALSTLPLNSTSEDRRAALSKVNHPTQADYAKLFQSPDFKAANALRKEVREQNKAKRKRAAALRRGENVNFRQHRVAGDPKI
jgi:hypothetical protein